MNVVRTKPRSQSRQSPSPSRGSDGSSTGGFGAPAVQMAERATQPVLGAYYGAGPALSLGGNGSIHGANSHGAVGSGADNRSNGAGGVQFKLPVAERLSTGSLAAVQPCPCEEHAGTVEPPHVQRQDEKEESEADTGPTQLVQLWDCSEYDEPTCVQTQEVPQELPVQSKCADCEAEEQVQSKCADCEAEEQVQQEGTQAGSHNVIHSQARRGLQGASQSLPHADRIQAAFGHHDVSQVRASVGGNAEAANRRMGALAFTSGNRIGFREAPSLRLASHEAAHVVQQREGLSLPGNVGRPGDSWERHADRVAAAVVGGRSAEGVLDEVAEPEAPAENLAEGGGDSAQAAAAPAVQQQITSRAERVFEPASAPVEAPEPAAEGGQETAQASPAEAQPGERGEEGSSLEAAEEGDNEAPPEGITVARGAPAAGASASATGAPASAGVGPTPAAGPATPTAAEAPTSAPAAGAPTPGARTEATGGGGINAPCYNVDPPPRPANTPEPSSDNQGAESKAKPQVTFEPWPDEADQCPAEAAVAEGSQQMPQGLGEGEGSAAAGGILVAGIATGAPSGSQAGAPTSPAGGEGGAASASGEVQAMSMAATTGADQSVAQASPMDGPIASAEGDRDTAVNEYLASTERLGGVISRSRSLEAGVTFPSAAGRQMSEARQAAIAQTRDFMARAAGQIADAVAFAQVQVPGTLGGAAEATKASIQGAIETEKAAISDRIAQARVQARTGAAAARAQVNAEYTTSAALIESMTLAAIAALDSTHSTSLDQVDQKETAGLDDVNSRFATGRTRHEEKGPEYADKALTRGQEHAHAYERCKRDYADDGFWDGCLTVRRARAQQDAACKTAAGYKETFLRTANKKGYDLIALRKQYRCAVIAGARQVNQTLDNTHDQLVSGLETGRMQALGGITLARDQNLAAINAALRSTLTSLSTQEFSQRQAVNDTGYLKQLAVEQLAHAGAASLAGGIVAAMDSLEQTLTLLRERFAKGGIPDSAWLAQTLATSEAALGGGMGSLLAKMEEGTQEAVGRLEELGAAANEALRLITSKNDELSAQTESGFAQQMGSLMAGASKAIGQLTQNHVDQAQQAMTAGTASMEQAVAGFDGALATIGGRVDEAINASLQELDRDLKNKLAELDGQITSEAWKAAEKEQPAWKSVVAIVLVILVIIAAAVISIVTLGAGASLFAIILVGALVGAVSGGLIQIINNWASGEAWHTGLAQAMIMGAIGGAIGGGLGFAGGALAAGAAQAGARAVTQLAITVGADLVSEGITQTIGYVAFGQKFNWQGFVMAGAMSGVSFRAHPTARPGMPRPEVPTPGAAGVAASRRAAVAQVAGGAAVGLGVEAVTSAISGERFDLTKAASAAASGAVGARMSRRGGAAGPAPEPTTRLGRAAERFRSFDPGGVGARLESRLQGVGARLAGGPPADGSPTGIRPPAAEELPTTRAPEETPTTRPPAEEAPTIRPGGEEPAVRPAEEPGAATGRRPLDADTEESGALRVDDPEVTRSRTTEIPSSETRSMRMGDTSHDVTVRQGPNGPELWICSAQCGALTTKIDRMLTPIEQGGLGISPSSELGRRLIEIRAEVEAVRTNVAPTDQTTELWAVAARLRATATEHPHLGSILDTPGSVANLGLHPPGSAEPITLRDSTVESVPDLRSRAGWADQQLLYIVRERLPGGGTRVLKVGESRTHLNPAGEPYYENQFSQYRRAAARLNPPINIEIEVAPVQVPGGRPIEGASGIEQQLRSQVTTGERGSLPWDAFGGGLGPEHVGPAVPFQQLPGGSPRRETHVMNTEGRWVPRSPDVGIAPTRTSAAPSAQELRRRIEEAGGNVTEAARRYAADTGSTVPRQTFHDWLRNASIDPKTYRR